MGLLDRFKSGRSSDRHFWRMSPLRTRDVAVLHYHGMKCVSQQDGSAMMQTGWALWSITASVHEHQAFDLLSGGFELWSSSPAHDVSQAKAFLEELFDRLAASDPPVPADIWAAPADQVQPLSTYYSARCWAGSELIGRGAGDADEIYDAIARTHAAFVPPRSMAWAKLYAERHDRPAPWGATDATGA